MNSSTEAGNAERYVQIKGTFMAQIYRANEGENHVFESKMIVST